MLKKIVQIVTLTLLFLFCSAYSISVQGDNGELNTPRIVPGNFYYPVKRVWEKIRVRIAFSKDAKISIYKTLTNERFRELEYLSENRRVDQLEKASQRFSFESGRLAEYIIENKIDYKEVSDSYEKYSSKLIHLRDLFEANSSNWLFLQQNIDTLKDLKEKLGG